MAISGVDAITNGSAAMAPTLVEYGRRMGTELFDLSGRRALVTGGGRGLGRAMAEALANAGASVAVIGRSADADDAARALGGVSVRADLTDGDALRAAFAEAVERLGGLDVLVTAHGTTLRAPALDVDRAGWDEVLETNLGSVFDLCRLAGGWMTAAGHGKIVTVASMLSFSGGIGVSAYAASKGGVTQLTKALANEWAPYGVNVNAIAPGYVRTELTAPLWRDDPGRSAAILERIPAGRWGEPADLAGATVFLASAASDYVHGIVLPVDGGWLAR
jgi:2-deoxy-D-gluconate 3-dehydrogenase